MEAFELVNEQNLPLWKIKDRQAVHQDGDWHRSAEVWIINEDFELLLNLRHPDKDLFATLWDVCVAGHLQAGENYRTCALREVAEELGQKIPSSDLVFVDVWKMDGYDTTNQLHDREFAGVFVWKTNLPIQAFTPQADEIADLRFVPMKQVQSDLEKPGIGLSFIPLENIFLDILHRIETTVFV
ncbi:MAG: NUDIX domain-containing protein [Siphonobacter sp.]